MSRSSSRHGYQRSSPVPHIPQVENLILPDGPVGEEAAGLLNEFVHSNEDTPIDAADDEDPEEDLIRRRLPWWKRPSPWWQLSILPFAAVAVSAAIAPRIEIYTLLACSVHKPDIFDKTLNFGGYAGFPTIISPHVALPPVIPTNPGEHANSSLFSSISVSGLQNGMDTAANASLCASDPVVQAAVARLTAVMSTTMGILSCLTTGWWGSFSDRHGRMRVTGIGVFGLLFNDFNFIFVTLFSRHLPGRYWFLILGSIVEGCVGGMATSSAAMHAYLADTTTESARSRTFSLILGLLFTGMALGPTLGGLLIRFTGHVLSVFYAAGLIHFVYACMVWFVVPESLSLQRMKRLRRKYMAEADGRRVHGVVKRLFAFLSPLSLLMPEMGDQKQGNDNSLTRKGRDWNLVLVAASYGCTVMHIGTFSYTLQYMASTFGWTSEKIGYFLSLIGGARAVFLTLMLPLAIKLFMPKPVIVHFPINTERNISPSLSSVPGSSESEPLLSPTSPKSTIKSPTQLDSPHFDLALARVSLFVDICSYVLISFVPTVVAFTLGHVLASMSGGFSPAMQSVALGLYKQRGGTESGKLFGALSVVQALCSQILGPMIYGLVYMRMVAIFPRGIFVMTATILVISFLLLAFVRLPKEPSRSRASGVVRSHEDAEFEVTGGELGR